MFSCILVLTYRHSHVNGSAQYTGDQASSYLVWCIHIYYCMTGRAIRGDIPFEIDSIGPTEGRDDTEVEYGILPRIVPTRGIAIIDLLYDFRITIGMGNNEHLYRLGQ